MVSLFPKQICGRAIAIYLVALLTVSFVYTDYAMGFGGASQ